MTRYVLLPRAKDDIVDISEQGVLRFGTSQARKYHDELYQLFDLIAANPRMARERNELSFPVRLKPFNAHLIIYRIEDDGHVSIIRICHGHEDWSATRSGE